MSVVASTLVCGALASGALAAGELAAGTLASGALAAGALASGATSFFLPELRQWLTTAIPSFRVYPACQRQFSVVSQDSCCIPLHTDCACAGLLSAKGITAIETAKMTAERDAFDCMAMILGSGYGAHVAVNPLNVLFNHKSETYTMQVRFCVAFGHVAMTTPESVTSAARGRVGHCSPTGRAEFDGAAVGD